MQFDKDMCNAKGGAWFSYCVGIGDQDFKINSAINFLNESGGIDDLKEWWL
jgi:hypothetical protein